MGRVGVLAVRSKAEPYAGAGLGYSFTPRLAVEGAWDFSRATKESPGFTGNLNAVTLGVRASF